MNYEEYLKVEKVKKIITSRVDNFNEENVVKQLNLYLTQDSDSNTMNYNDKMTFKNKVINSMLNYDILQPFVEDDEINEIMINGIDNIFIEKKGEILLTGEKFHSIDHINNLVSRIVSEIDRSINDSNPIVDARLKDGSRVNIITSPVSLCGPVITIRKFRKDELSVDMLIESKTINKQISEFLNILIKSKFNIFINGATSSGKTTFLNCLTQMIDKDERIITIEDSAELIIKGKPNLIRLETRVNSTNSITMSHLIKNSLRMRPDRVIIGEVRGNEVMDMLQAMNTGHDGSLSTGHGNSNIDMVNRLLIIAMASSGYNESTIKSQIISAIDFIVHLKRLKNNRRVVYEISEIDKSQKDFKLRSIFKFNFDNEGEYIVADKLIENIEKVKLWGLENEYAEFIKKSINI